MKLWTYHDFSDFHISFKYLVLQMNLLCVSIYIYINPHMTGWGWWWGGCCSKANKEFTWKNIHVPEKNQTKTTYQKKKKKSIQNKISQPFTCLSLILSQAQSLYFTEDPVERYILIYLCEVRQKETSRCSIFSLFGLVFFLIAVIAKKLGLKLNYKERHLGVSMVCLIMHLWCNFT